MIELLTPDFKYSDERGTLWQLCNSGYKQVNITFSKAGVTRGGHYHKLCREAFFVVSGSVIIKLRQGQDMEEHTFSSGDFFLVKPMVSHSLYFPEGCTLIVLYDKPVELENGLKDIYMEGK